MQSSKDKFLGFYRAHGRMPSYSEICGLMGYRSKNAAFRLVANLIEEGIVAKSLKGKIVPGKDLMRKLVPVGLVKPLRVLGTVQAGFPTDALEQELDTLSLDEYLIKNPAESFMLRVSGDSMIDEGIRPDDLVIVERGRDPKTGDVVLAQIDGEWTLKFFERRGGKVRLIPGNKNYPVLEPKTELKIPGVVTSVIRKYF